jgi:hypothetical protein
LRTHANHHAHKIADVVSAAAFAGGALGAIPEIRLRICDIDHLPRHRYKQRQRHTTFGWIRIRANDSIQQLEKIDHRSLNAAWRHVAEAWLRCQGLITVSINKKCYPITR